MQSIKRQFLLCFALSALVFAGARAWGYPFVGVNSDSMVAEAQDQPQEESNQSSTFTGTIVRDGEQFALHDSSGAVYKLDDSERAKLFEGKAVKVTGRLDTEAKLIHVDSIEAVKA